MLPMGMHRMEIPTARRTRVTEPDDVEDFARQGWESIAVRVPATVFDGSRIVGRLAGKIDLDEIRQAVVGFALFGLPDQVVLPI